MADEDGGQNPLYMPLYSGTKTIRARPMSRQAYNDYRGWTLPADEDGSDEGFLVEYVDGGKSNDPRHDGYISWSPAGVFERAYSLCETHVDRMRAELTELGDRIQKLTAFMMTSGTAYEGLSDCDKALLNAQHGAMLAYQGVLIVRYNLAIGR